MLTGVNKDINYFSGVEADESSVSMIYSSQVDGPQYGNVLKSVEELLTRWDIPRYPKPVVEKVDWYDINPGYENARWLIVHTNGNPFRSDIRKSQGNTKLPFTSTDPKVIRNEMNHIPKHSGSGSSRMRCQFLSKVLNTNNRIDRVYVATDMDVAGSYTASLLPGFNRLSNIKEIQRVRLNNTTPEGIRAAIKAAFPFDWHNAEAGRLRATIDFVIGRGFFKVIEDVSSFQQVPTKISFGRTRLLALDCLYRRWREAQTWQGSGNIYMVFIGLGDEHSISEQLRRGAFLSVALKTMRGSFSPAGLLRELMVKEVGTVSTRYKLIENLISQGMVHQEGVWLIPTHLGALTHEIILRSLNESFNLWEWNHRINEFLYNAGSFKDHSLNSLRDITDDEIKAFLKQFLPTLYERMPASISLLYKLADFKKYKHLRGYKERKGNSRSQEQNSVEDSNLVGAIDLSQIEKYIDFENNRFIPVDNVFLRREVSVPDDVDREGMLRRILKLEREVGFEIVHALNLPTIEYLPESMCSSFRATCSLSDLSKIFELNIGLQKEIEVFDYISVEKPEQDNGFQDSHEPLGLFDVTPGDIAGPEGFLVASEYMRPYRYTTDLYKASMRKFKLLEKFRLGDIVFQRVHPFKYGTVHTFDTLLSDMYDRHLMSFNRTAEIAESLYLGGGA